MANFDKSGSVNGSSGKSFASLDAVKTELQHQGADVAATAMKIFDEAKEKSTQAVKRSMKAIDDSAQSHPWAYAGAAALAGGVIGYLLRSRFSRSSDRS